MERGEIISAVNEALDKRRGEDTEHKSDHAFLRMLEERERRKDEMWEKVKTQVLGWGIIAVVGGIGAWLLNHFTFKG